MKNRADILMTLSTKIANDYHEDLFDETQNEKYPKLVEQVIKHDAFELYGVEDLTGIEISFVKKMIKKFSE